VGTANFVNPRATLDIIRDLETFLTQEGIGSIKELVGQVRVA
jgi:dihydroorotate dehydrogenase (NAD+) catalytic subunit